MQRGVAACYDELGVRVGDALDREVGLICRREREPCSRVLEPAPLSVKGSVGAWRLILATDLRSASTADSWTVVDTGGMATYVQWCYSDEGIWGYDELDDERWSTRHIEVHAREETFLAAASLAEVCEARDSGDPDAVNAYERRYGIVPEAPLPVIAADGESLIEPIPAEKFERLWLQGRQARERLHDHAFE